jgi:hypothetical protein
MRRDSYNFRVDVQVLWSQLAQHGVHVFLSAQLSTSIQHVCKEGDLRSTVHREPLGLASELQQVMVMEETDKRERREIQCSFVRGRRPDSACHGL